MCGLVIYIHVCYFNDTAKSFSLVSGEFYYIRMTHNLNFIQLFSFYDLVCCYKNIPYSLYLVHSELNFFQYCSKNLVKLYPN